MRGRPRREATVDTGALYARKREQLVALVRACSDAELDRAVPATPDWRVRDALAHVVGITADMNRLDFGQGDPEAWTARQVDTRRGRTVDELAAEWEQESPRFEEGLRLLGYSIGSHYVGDLHAHLQDVLAALGQPADRDELTVRVSLDFYLESFGEQLDDNGVGAVAVHAAGEEQVVGSGATVATVVGDPFELLRAFSGRRSLDQVRRLAWTGAPDRVVPVVSRYPFPEHDLVD